MTATLLFASTAGAGHGTPQFGSTTFLFALLLVAMIVCLALEEKLHAKKSVIVGLFAVVSLLLAAAVGILPFGDVTLPNGHHIAMPVFIPAIDWGVICIIVGSSIFVDVTSRSGLFTWIAIKLTKASTGDPLKLLWYYGLMTVVFSAVLNNVTAMIIVGSLTGVSLKKLGRMDKLLGFLIIEGLLTNIGGLLTLISSVPNIIVGNAAGISFVKFFIVASPYVAVATVVTLLMGAKLFGIDRLATAEEKKEAAFLVSGFDENDVTVTFDGVEAEVDNLGSSEIEVTAPPGCIAESVDVEVDVDGLQPPLFTAVFELICPNKALLHVFRGQDQL